MNDSSYDSLENELNDDPESPYQEQLPLRDKDKPDSRSRDSVITLSDCDPDPDPEGDLQLQLPPLGRPRRFSPVARQPRGRPTGGASQPPRRLRRSSEPALALASTSPLPAVTPAPADSLHLPARKASYDAAMEGGGDEDEVFMEQSLSALQLKEEEEDGGGEAGRAKVQVSGRRKTKHGPPPPLRLDASCSSLSSPATSPTGSSLSSLDSAFSQYSTDYATTGTTPSAEPAPLSPVFAGRPQLSPRGSPPQRDWPQPPRSSQPHSHGLHPNTWLRKERRLSLKQPDNGHSEESLTVNGRSHAASNGCCGAGQEAGPLARERQRRSSSPPSYQQALLQLQRSRSPFYRGSDKPLTVKELRQLHDRTCNYRPLVPAGSSPRAHTGSEVTARPARSESTQPPLGVFYGQSATTLVLQRQKSQSLTQAVDGQQAGRSLPRRSSEPAKVTAASVSSPTLTLDRPHPARAQPQEDGLRVTGVEADRVESHFCLSPSATRAVRDYFSSQSPDDADSCLKRSQEVARAIVQGKQEWQSRRCSDPRVEEFDQLFFAEESYV